METGRRNRPVSACKNSLVDFIFTLSYAIFAVKFLEMEKLKNLYKNEFGSEPQSVVRLTGDGSNRVYYRMTGVANVIGAIGTSVEENRAFIALSKAMQECGVLVPTVLAVSDDESCYIQDDLGDVSLYGAMTSARENGVFKTEDVECLSRVVAELPKIQFGVPEYFDFSLCYPVAEFNERTIMWDLNYFKYCFLKGVGIEFNENRLEDEFVKLTAMLLSDNDNVFLYRDFQSRNVMLKDGKPFFIDFQGGRRGPIYYDIASFVGQARAKYTDAAVGSMIDAYLEALAAYKSTDRVHFMKMLQLFRVFRLLQNLGAYGYRGLFERKKAFVESIPAALEQLAAILDGNEYPYIMSLVKEISVLPMFVRSESKELVVDVVSFSYKRGIPDDTSGNGGGFVFDCRAIHNPGRYEPYKKLTGMDAPVIEFLEKESNIAEFLENAYALVDNMVDTYKKRGFTHVQVCCGCTGGQHRSVYSAEHIARHVADKFGVKVVVTHKMQGVHYVIEARGE